jgi:hypothetical protein
MILQNLDSPVVDHARKQNIANSQGASKFQRCERNPSDMETTATPVTVDNFIRAETDRTFTGMAKMGGFGKFHHFRDLTQLDEQVVPRCNRDTLYSTAVFDLDAGPVTITLPDAGNRFMTMIVIDEDHYVSAVVYKAGSHSFNRDKIGTRYVLMAMRILVDPTNPKDVEQVHTLQNAVKVSQKNPGSFAVPNWDKASQDNLRDALSVLGSTLPDFRKAFGSKEQVDPVRHLIATATAWGGNPDKDAIYLNITPMENDGSTTYKLNAKDVPVDGFWSVSVYGPDGYFHKNERDAYTLNNITAKKDPDGSVTIQFGGCGGKTPNCLPIMKGWNYVVRLYRPHAEILDGKWRFPEPQPCPQEVESHS